MKSLIIFLALLFAWIKVCTLVHDHSLGAFLFVVVPFCMFILAARRPGFRI